MIYYIIFNVKINPYDKYTNKNFNMPNYIDIGLK